MSTLNGRTPGELLAPPVATIPPASEPPEEYLSVRQLSARIPYAQQTIRNLMSQGVFRLGQHYVKPRGRVVFKWSAVRAWLDAATDRSRMSS